MKADRPDMVIDRLLLALGRMSDHDLALLRRIFDDPSAKELLRASITNILGLRERERSIRTQSNGSRNVPRQSEIPTRGIQKDNVSASQIRNTVIRILFDKSAFPSTRDVLEAVNHAFGFNFSYEEYQKRGRRDLVQNCWSKIDQMSEIERGRKLKDFLDFVVSDVSQPDEYKKLFRILTRQA
jgi:hypothetical protein